MLLHPRPGTQHQSRFLGLGLGFILLLALNACMSTPLPHHAANHAYKHTGKHANKHIGKHSHHGKSVIRYVRANDTLFNIGKKFGIDYRIIAKRNHIPYPYKIYIGQRLYIDRKAPKRFDPVASKFKTSKKAPQRAKKTKQTKAKHTKVRKKIAKPSHRSPAKGYSGHMLWPVHGVVTSKFGRRGSRMHDGIDIGAKEGSPVYAAASGTIVYSDSRLSGYGNLIIIRHSKNLFTAYGHNQRNLVRKGTRVKAGAVIAKVGHTGRATGPHLHFEVRQGSTPVNPIAYLPRR